MKKTIIILLICIVVIGSMMWYLNSPITVIILACAGLFFTNGIVLWIWSSKEKMIQEKLKDLISKELNNAEQDEEYYKAMGFEQIHQKSQPEDDRETIYQMNKLHDPLEVFNELFRERSVLRGEIKRKIVELGSLYKVSSAISSVLNLNELLQMIIELALKIVNATTGSLMLIDESGEFMTIKVGIGIKEDIVDNTRIIIGKGIAGWVAQEGQPLLIKDLNNDERFGKFKKGSKKEEQVATKYTTASLISVPLRIKDKIIGVLNINNKKDESIFNDDDLELIMILANHAAISIENTRLYSNINEQFVNIVRVATNALEAKDTYTLGHSERVTQYGVDIAKRMNLDMDFQDNVRRAGVLHDIGKIGIPESILLKTSRLTDEEFEAIKSHPKIGYHIVEPMNMSQEIRDGILLHHERFDGRGYPKGLKGEEIPLIARILNVADSFDAMTSTRPYRKALPNFVVIAEIEKNIGTQFDPNCADVFLELLKEQGYFSDDDREQIDAEKNRKKW